MAIETTPAVRSFDPSVVRRDFPILARMVKAIGTAAQPVTFTTMVPQGNRPAPRRPTQRSTR